MTYKDDNRGPMYYFRDSLVAALSERLQVPILTNNTRNLKGLPMNLKMTSIEAFVAIQNL